MANHKSAIKRMRQNRERRVYNMSIRSHVKTRVKSVLSTVEGQDSEEARAELLKAIKVIDQAAAKGVLHKNTASRKVSRLTKKVNALASN